MKPLIDSTFMFMAKQAEIIEGERTATSRRLKQMLKSTDEPDTDGICRGKGYPENHPDVQTMKAHLERLEQSEKEFKKQLEKNFKKNELATVVAGTYGLGIPMTAKLLGLIGDPYIKPQHVDIETGEVTPPRVRTMSELFSYCGLTPHTMKKKGVTCKYSPAAQSTLWNIAEAIQKIPNDKAAPLKDVWTKYKQYYSTRVDDKGKPWNWTHVKHAAHRKVGREVLKALYLEAAKLHEQDLS